MHDDPLWYDRCEPDTPPGAVLTALARLVLAACRVYRLPDLLYRRGVEAVERRLEPRRAGSRR